jgi:hypothetical protein
MTAVEWLAEKYNEVNWLRNREEISSKYADELREGFLNQAKEMEKQQQDEKWDEGFENGYYGRDHDDEDDEFLDNF